MCNFTWDIHHLLEQVKESYLAQDLQHKEPLETHWIVQMENILECPKLAVQDRFHFIIVPTQITKDVLTYSLLPLPDRLLACQWDQSSLPLSSILKYSISSKLFNCWHVVLCQDLFYSILPGCTLTKKCFVTHSKIFRSTTYKSTIWQPHTLTTMLRLFSGVFRNLLTNEGYTYTTIPWMCDVII